jgi:hypothetical protein
VFSNKKIVALSRSYICVMIDLTHKRDHPLLKRYKYRGIPYLLILNPEGREIGVLNRDPIKGAAQLKGILKKYPGINNLLTVLKTIKAPPWLKKEITQSLSGCVYEQGAARAEVKELAKLFMAVLDQ